MKKSFLQSMIVLLIVKYSTSCFSKDDNSLLKCIPKSVFTYDHNICFCNHEGTEITCKRKLYSTLAPELHHNQLQNITSDCTPHNIFQLPCNECICHESGKYALCIRKECSKEESAIETSKNCTTGSVFNEYCNGCICGSDGKAACTKLDCKAIGWIKSGIQCVPNTQLMVKCNNCDCSDDGKTMSCDRMGCDSMSFFHAHILNVTMSCQNTSIFDYNCHKCFCNEEGNYAMCSGMQCPHTYDFTEVEDTVDKCNPGMIIANNCNVCICDDDGKGTCTTLNCDLDYRFKYVQDLNFATPEI